MLMEHKDRKKGKGLKGERIKEERQSIIHTLINPAKKIYTYSSFFKISLEEAAVLSVNKILGS